MVHEQSWSHIYIECLSVSLTLRCDSPGETVTYILPYTARTLDKDYSKVYGAGEIDIHRSPALNLFTFQL